MHIAITGATGKVGSAIVSYLLAQGHVVHALCRNLINQGMAPAHPNLCWFKGDLSEEATLRAMLENTDGLVHAAFSHEGDLYRGGEGSDIEGFIEVNLNRTKKLFDLAGETGTKRVVFLSSRAVFDHTDWDGRRIDDEAIANPNTLYAEVKRNAEIYGSSLVEIDFFSLRATGIYGMGHSFRGSKWDKLAKEVLCGETNYASLSNQSHTEVHESDVASAVNRLFITPATDLQRRYLNCSDVAISEHQLVVLMHRIVNNVDPLGEWLPDAIPASRVMDCEGLRELGWQARGLTGLIATLREVLERHQSMPS